MINFISGINLSPQACVGTFKFVSFLKKINVFLFLLISLPPPPFSVSKKVIYELIIIECQPLGCVGKVENVKVNCRYIMILCWETRPSDCIVVCMNRISCHAHLFWWGHLSMACKLKPLSFWVLFFWPQSSFPLNIDTN